MHAFAKTILEHFCATKQCVSSADLAVWFQLSADEEGSLVNPDLFHFSLPQASKPTSLWDATQSLKVSYSGLSKQAESCLGIGVMAAYSASFTTLFSLVLTRCLLSSHFKTRIDDGSEGNRRSAVERFKAQLDLAQLEAQVAKQVLQLNASEGPVALSLESLERIKDIWTRFPPMTTSQY